MNQGTEGSSIFQTEIDMKMGEEFLVKDLDVVHILTFRAHYNSIIHLNIDEDLNPVVLTTSSQDCEVFIWDLNSKIKNKLYGNTELQQVGSLIIKGKKNSWMITPNKEQKTMRQRIIKEEIIEKALRIRKAI